MLQTQLRQLSEISDELNKFIKIGERNKNLYLAQDELAKAMRALIAAEIEESEKNHGKDFDFLREKLVNEAH